MFIRANGYYMRGRLIDVTIEDEKISLTKRYIRVVASLNLKEKR
jgi:hypothetical protein